MPNFFTLSLSLLIIPLTVCVLCRATAQVTPDSTLAPSHGLPTPEVFDSLKAIAGNDTLHIQDSLALGKSIPDTLGRMSTPSLVGTYDRTLGPDRVITKDDLHWLDYRYLGGILESMPGTFVRAQNSAGQYDQLSIRGMDWRSIAITVDGRLQNDPASGVFNLYHFTTEYADRIEVITGPRAFLYGLNSTGGAINLVTKNYNSNRPFTKLNYSETGYNYQYSDGTFSQNISRKVNFTFGFQHQGTDGRFPNSAHDAWNARVKVRYNFSRDFNLILSEYHTSTHTQLNGGVNFVLAGPASGLDPFQPTLMRDAGAYEKITRNDVDLSLVGTFLGDTTNVSLLNFYYSHSIREYRDGEDVASTFANQMYVRSDHTTSWMGARFMQNFDTELQQFSLGSDVELRQIEGSPNLSRHRNVVGNVWAKEELLLGDRLSIAGFGRYDQYLRKSYTGIGADATVKVVNGLSLFAGISHSRRMPTYEELYWTDSTVSRTDPIVAEKHVQFEAGAELRLPDNSFIRASYFHRTVDDAIEIVPFSTSITRVFPTLEFVNVPRVITHGIEARVGMHVWVLYLEGTGTYLLQTTGGNDTRLYPKISANGGIYYWKTLLNDKLELKVGFSGRYQSSYLGAEFNPEVLAYVLSGGPVLGQSSSGDFFVTAHIGDAYIHLMWENLTSVQYYSTPFYPILDREIRLGVSWEFLN